MPTIVLQLPANSYSIQIESGLLHRLGELVADVILGRRALVAIDSAIIDSHGAMALQSLHRAGIESVIDRIEATESQKSLESAAKIYQTMMQARLDRTQAVIAMGGGIVGDLAGFAAATYMRGVPVIHVPTTLLAMVDASIGGKTAVNLADSRGQLMKNVIGAFWQPRAVLIDPNVLATLDARHIRCGLAECVKHALIADADLLTFIDECADDIVSLKMDAMSALIERSARIKAAIVAEDEREAGHRAVLNLGHTFAHAIETISQLNLYHGEAVAIGLAAAMHCSVLTNRMTSDQQQRVMTMLTKLQLPMKLPNKIPVAPLLEKMKHDKKIRDGRMRLVLPLGLGAVEIVEDLPESIIIDAWISVDAAN